ncbi:MAG: molybdopterin-dependent oxidoreductase [Deltaproteobacteria bacterium]|nr:molybdopterin-dependent oxidoreductase [Candidatus Anaeroferrophillus wilburensis]MBN2887867.1 molybdopterin-dependent oxidoreductase [Deltaproteobacteria bacterium]
MARKTITRRTFLGTMAAGAAATTLLPSLVACNSRLKRGEFVGRRLHTAGEEAYRQAFVFDKTVRTSCAGNCTQACGWNAFVKGDKYIVASEPAGDYDRFDPVLGTQYNPRGCMRGASYLKYINSPVRLKHPLIRVGRRGEGKFRRATWDEAMNLITTRMTNIVRRDGSDAIAFFCPIPSFNYVSAGAGYRLCKLMGAAGPLSFYDWYCDLPPGEPMTWAFQTDECEEADWINAKLLIFWGANVAESRLAAAHLLPESRYRGAKVVGIFTDYNATARMADQFISPKPGTDAAMIMGLIKILLDNQWYDEEYTKTFTDLPLLIRSDNKKFLRETDMVPGGSPFKLYLWDRKSNWPALAPGTMGDQRDTLDLAACNLDPLLDFSGRVTLNNGQGIAIQTVFNRLREEVKSYTPQKVTAITSVGGQTLKKLAYDLHTMKPAMIVEGGGTNHWFHNDINNRAMILLMALTGNIGKSGSGFNQYTGQYKVWLSGLGAYGMIAKARPQNGTLFVWSHYDAQLWQLGKTFPELVAAIEKGSLTTLPNGVPVSADPQAGWAYNYYLLIQSLANKWMPVYPKPPKRPKAMVIWRANFLNQGKSGHRTKEWFADEQLLELVVTIDFRVTSTGMYADVILPAATWYEKFDIETTPMHPYLQAQSACIKPLYEARTDFDIFKDLAKRLQDEAKELVAGGQWNGTWDDREKKQIIDFTTLYDTFTAGGTLDSDVQAAKFILEKSPMIYPNPDEYRQNKAAFAPEMQKLIEEKLFAGNISGYLDGIIELIKEAPVPFPAAQYKRPLVPFAENVAQKLPWPGGGTLAAEKVAIAPGITMPKLYAKKFLGMIAPKTLTGRQQFYIDHSTFLTSNNELPIYQEPEYDLLPDGKTRAPLKFNSPHGRWGTHSTFRDIDVLLRLQRGEVIIMMAATDARQRRITDGDVVKVFNQYGEMVCKVKVSPGIRSGEVRVENGGEMFNCRAGWFNLLTPIRPKPTQAAKYPEEPDAPYHHLKYGWNLWGVTGNECDTSVEVTKI